MSFGGGFSKSDSQQYPNMMISPRQLADYSAWSQYVAGPEPTNELQFADPGGYRGMGAIGDYQGMGEGDYNDLYKSYSAPVYEAADFAGKETAQLAGDRGLSSYEPSRLALQDKFVWRPMQQGLLAAKGQALNMKASDLANRNQYALGRAGLQSEDVGRAAQYNLSRAGMKQNYNTQQYETPWTRWLAKKQDFYGGKGSYGGGGSSSSFGMNMFGGAK